MIPFGGGRSQTGRRLEVRSKLSVQRFVWAPNDLGISGPYLHPSTHVLLQVSGAALWISSDSQTVVTHHGNRGVTVLTCRCSLRCSQRYLQLFTIGTSLYAVGEDIIRPPSGLVRNGCR